MRFVPDPRVLVTVAALLVSGLLGGCAKEMPVPSTAASAALSTASAAPPSQVAEPPFDQIERRFGARLGVYVLDTGTGRTVTYHADDRFAYASTYKVLAAGVLLRRGADLDQVITYSASDLQEYSPITAQHVAGGMTLRDLLAAALQYSDNTAANLLLGRLGGPGGLGQALSGLGDTVTHVDRTEPSVNDAIPGDIRDTSTPRALGEDLRRFVLDGLLPGDWRQTLTNWLLGNTTGAPYIRAGTPAGWKVGDKTGSGDYGTRNDIAVAWPPGQSPIVIAIMSDRGRPDAASDDALIADATKAALAYRHS